eukprot:TRINITY_DN5964_c0_g1_i1.p3 TRINITY_DN5964_c0_g1~~TRINITY_DN5964_c0_g1_i1.p3  ORF type:complete len:216 (+),score=38.96 TRINITY_DN5964_c0_g1_i1:61-708(+)
MSSYQELFGSSPSSMTGRSTSARPMQTTSMTAPQSLTGQASTSMLSSASQYDELDRVRARLRQLQEPAEINDSHSQLSFNADTNDASTIQKLQRELDSITKMFENERHTWRQREAQQIDRMQTMLAEQAEMKRTEEDRARAIVRFEQELSEAVSAMTLERQRWEDERGLLQVKIDGLMQRNQQQQDEVSQGNAFVLLQGSCSVIRLIAWTSKIGP